MYSGQMIFGQLTDHLSRYEFQKCVARYHGDYYLKSFSCWDQFLCMAFAQLTYRESLRDIEACLRSLDRKLYHLGVRGHVSRSTLADANESRDWRIYADFAQVLIATARHLYRDESFGVDLAETVYALDATIINLCLSLCPWARYQAQHGAVKLHTLLDLRGSIPTCLRITHGKVADVDMLDSLVPEAGSFYIMDRGYLDFERLFRFACASAYFVTRTKRDVQLTRRSSRPVDWATGLRSDHTVVLTTVESATHYPDPLRRIHFVDPERHTKLVFLTNNFALPALTIAQLYKARWHVELFFKWIKQHLRIKTFYGTSENAVKTQIWIAIAVYVLVAIVRKRLALDIRDISLYKFLQILSITLFEKVPILQALSSTDSQVDDGQDANQLILFDL